MPMSSRKNLIPRDIRDLAARLKLRGPLYYAGTLNGEPNGYRSVTLEAQDKASDESGAAGVPRSRD